MPLCLVNVSIVGIRQQFIEILKTIGNDNKENSGFNYYCLSTPTRTHHRKALAIVFTQTN